jgi:hypothetical protein
MNEFHDPSPGAIPRNSSLRFYFLVPLAHMRNIGMGFHDQNGRITRVPLVGAKVLLDLFRREDDTAGKNGFKLGDVMPIGSGHDYRQRGAMLVHQDMALASFFFRDPSDSVPLFPSQGAL